MMVQTHVQARFLGEDMQTIQAHDAVGVKAKLFRGLADTSRLKVAESLRSGPRYVSEVVEATGLSQPNVSGHLACLYECGLVNRQQRGRFIYYWIADSRIEKLLSAADNLLIAVEEKIYVCTRYEEDGAKKEL